MTGFLVPGVPNPISRITIASLEDMGYQVDYSKAEDYGTEDLGAGCTCPRRQRSLLDMSHGEARQLGLGSPNATRRRLSEEMRESAIESGRAFLANNRAGSVSSKVFNEEYEYVGDQVVSVVIGDGDGGLFGIVVRPEGVDTKDQQP